MKQWEQKNLTITSDQIDVVKNLFGKVNIRSIAKEIGETYNKTHNNLRLLGMVKTKRVKQENTQFFNVDEFSKYYSY